MRKFLEKIKVKKLDNLEAQLKDFITIAIKLAIITGPFNDTWTKVNINVKVLRSEGSYW